MKKIFIIYVNYHSSEYILSSISNINKQKSDIVQLTVIIVDNSGEFINGSLCSEYNNIVILNNGRNIGYCGGNNLAYSYIIKNELKGDILICNPDTFFNISSLEKIIQQVEVWGIYTLPAYDTSGNLLYTKVMLKGLLQKISKKSNNTNFTDTDYCPGSFIYFKRDDSNHLSSLFDEDFFMYWEEVDLSLKIKKMNGKCCFVNNAGNIVRADNKDGWLNKAIYYYLRNAFLIKTKHSDVINSWDLFIFMIKSLAVFSIKAMVCRNEKMFKNMFLGVRDRLKNKFGKN